MNLSSPAVCVTLDKKATQQRQRLWEERRERQRMF